MPDLHLVDSPGLCEATNGARGGSQNARRRQSPARDSRNNNEEQRPHGKAESNHRNKRQDDPRPTVDVPVQNHSPPTGTFIFAFDTATHYLGRMTRDTGIDTSCHISHGGT